MLDVASGLGVLPLLAARWGWRCLELHVDSLKRCLPAQPIIPCLLSCPLAPAGGTYPRWDA